MKKVVFILLDLLWTGSITAQTLPVAEDGKEWTNHIQDVHPEAPLKTLTMKIVGDTVVGGKDCKKLYQCLTDEYGAKTESMLYCHQEGEVFYKNGVKMFDFGLQQGEHFQINEGTDLVVTHVGDTVLSDGVTRKCLTVNPYVEGQINNASDLWIEGIGSLKLGIYDNDFYLVGTRRDLQSVMLNGEYIYQREQSSGIPHTPVIEDAFFTPECPSVEDEVTFTAEAGVFYGNNTYMQQLDSIVGDTVYVSAAYNSHNMTVAMFSHRHELPLGKLKAGQYTLKYTIRELNGTAIKSVTVHKYRLPVTSRPMLPLFEKGKVWESTGQNLSISPTLGQTYYKRTDRIYGDTLIAGVPHYGQHVRIVYANGDIRKECHYVPKETVNYGEFDFTLNEGDFKLYQEGGNYKQGWMVTEVSDTTLTDGISRRCLKVDFVTIQGEETVTQKKDVWVEGVGSLVSGIVLDIPALLGSGTHSLKSVSQDGRYIHHPEGETYALESMTAANKMWHCTRWKNGLTELEDRYYQVQGDTVIDGITAHKVYLRFSKDGEGGTYQGAIYEDGEQVLCCHAGQTAFGLLYDFGLVVGQTVTIDGETYKVDGRDTIAVGGCSLTRIRITGAEDSESYNTWVEGFGSLTGLLASGVRHPGGYESVHTCSTDGETVITYREMDAPFAKPSWVGAVWSYISYEYDRYDFVRYTVLDEPEVIEGYTYYPLVEYSACTYEPGKESGRWRIRQEAGKVYVLATDMPDYDEVRLSAPYWRTSDYILYDFDYVLYKSYCTYLHYDGEKQGMAYTTIYMGDTTATSVEGGQKHRVIHLQGAGSDETWISGIGNDDGHLLYPFSTLRPTCICGMELNHFRSADGSVVYYNPKSGSEYDGFKMDDCTLVYSELPPGSVEKPTARVTHSISIDRGNITCTSPDAVKLEVYTLDAVKVGEARFTNGQATVKVNRTPATYLYIVTYPDGRRESGKTRIN